MAQSPVIMPSLETKNPGFQRLISCSLAAMRDVIERNHSPVIENGPQNARASLSEKDIFIVDSFDRLTEITVARDRIRQIRSLAGVSPQRQLDMDRVEYLRFFIEAYYQEVYIVESRINRWILWHERRIERNHSDRVICKRLREFIKESFKSTRAVRAAHVHEKRYFTEDLAYAAGLSILARTREPIESKSEIWEPAAMFTYKKARKAFIDQIDRDLKGIDDVLDSLSEHMLPFVMNQTQ